MILAVAALMTFAACNNNSKNKGVAFNPTERTSSLSEAEREAALAAKRAEYGEDINIDSLIAMHGVNFSVLAPAITDDLPQSASYMLGTRMVQVAAQNGIGGLSTNPVLAMVARVDCLDRALTGTAPQKAIAKYEVTFYCGNFITNDIYASASQELVGVGATLDEAARNAMRELKNSSDMQKMLSTASERALSWYNAQGNVQSFVDKAVSNREYGVAMALLSSVPSQSTTHEWAVKRNETVSRQFFEEKAAELLGAMQGAVAAGGDEYNPEVGAYLRLIAPSSKSYPEALKLYNSYIKRIETVRDDKRNKEHSLQMAQLAAEERERMEELELEKIKAPYEAQEAIARINADARVGVAAARNHGGFLGLGKLWDGTFNLLNKAFGL